MKLQASLKKQWIAGEKILPEESVGMLDKLVMVMSKKNPELSAQDFLNISLLNTMLKVS